MGLNPTNKKNPVHKELKKFGVAWDKIADDVIFELTANLKNGDSVSVATRKALKKVDYKKRMTRAISDTVTGSYIIGKGTKKVDVASFRKWFLNNHWTGEKLSISQRIAKDKSIPLIKAEIKRQLEANNAMRTMAKGLTDKNLVKADVAKIIETLPVLAKRVANGDMKVYSAYKKQIDIAKKQVDRLARNGARTEALKKAYSNVIRASEKLNKKQINKAIDRAIRNKARYNAERIVRTESAKAYGIGTVERVQDDPEATGIEWTLSSGHPKPDICDVNAEADIYGMGAGVYPVGKMPAFPAHPNCLCILDEYYGDKKPKAQNKSAQKKIMKKKNIEIPKKELNKKQKNLMPKQTV